MQEENEDKVVDVYTRNILQDNGERSLTSLAMAKRRSQMLQDNIYLDTLTYDNCTYILQCDEEKGTIEVLTKICLEEPE